ncbi:PIN domain-containing protein [Chitinimonas sp. BJB300]|uniref:PIN domain-containing protein n=1 Tax=Chitinimonas sp. BJB300 TaxID=1559339 RepID=UPI000C0EDEAF|nr:type II toxin-antitoxin system VapC family toxin [Chitinimonas sp. BJB300]PHV09617.1 VapC toxin family PIN domain ribonuclease [Chitinimonas sp. BJB300]TSJ84505.1 type II toxin-antitoxin system VapC family toxin [Chitinimonas sp. BJB300]
MIGIDTNVLVRHIAQDDPVQSPQATTFFQYLTPSVPGFISLIVLIEAVWVMQRAYKADPAQLVMVLDTLLRTKELVVQHADVAWKALHRYSNSTADFSDCLIECMASEVGCTKTVTFDRGAVNQAGMVMLGE